MLDKLAEKEKTTERKKSNTLTGPVPICPGATPSALPPSSSCSSSIILFHHHHLLVLLLTLQLPPPSPGSTTITSGLPRFCSFMLHLSDLYYLYSLCSLSSHLYTIQSNPGLFHLLNFGLSTQSFPPCSHRKQVSKLDRVSLGREVHAQVSVSVNE